MMVGHAVEFSKHQCLSRGIYDAHAAENWSRSTDSSVTTRIEVGRIRHVRLSLRDGWAKCRYGKNEPGQQGPTRQALCLRNASVICRAIHFAVSCAVTLRLTYLSE